LRLSAKSLPGINYTLIGRLGSKLVDGYKKTIAKVGLQGYIASAGANGALMLYPKEIRNYRDWLPIDVDLWRHYWFGMVNRGVMAQPYWWDEQWTISVQHTDADIDQHLAAFADVAESLATAQHERLGSGGNALMGSGHLTIGHRVIENPRSGGADGPMTRSSDDF